MTNAPAVGLRYLKLAHQVRRTIDERLSTDGVSLARLKLLQAVDRLGPVNQARLADELNMAARSVTQAVEALERDGLVRRTASPSDRRAKLVALTSTGSAAMVAGVSAGEKILHEIFGDLDAEQIATMEALLDIIEASVAPGDEDIDNAL